MAEQERVTTDNIMVVKPDVADSGPLADPSANEHTLEPLDVEEATKARTKLRLYAILTALYVCKPMIALSEVALNWLTTFLPARPLRSSLGPNYHCNIDPHNLRRFGLCFRLHLDRRRVCAR